MQRPPEGGAGDPRTLRGRGWYRSLALDKGLAPAFAPCGRARNLECRRGLTPRLSPAGETRVVRVGGCSYHPCSCVVSGSGSVPGPRVGRRPACPTGASVRLPGRAVQSPPQAHSSSSVCTHTPAPRLLVPRQDGPGPSCPSRLHRAPSECHLATPVTCGSARTRPVSVCSSWNHAAGGACAREAGSPQSGGREPEVRVTHGLFRGEPLPGSQAALLATSWWRGLPHQDTCPVHPAPGTSFNLSDPISRYTHTGVRASP